MQLLLVLLWSWNQIGLSILSILTFAFFNVDFRPSVATESIVRLALVLFGDCGVVVPGPLVFTKTPPGPGGLRCTPSVCLFRW